MGRGSVFNILGPLLNPVEGRKRQLMGVYDPGLLNVVPTTLRELGIDRAMVVHGRGVHMRSDRRRGGPDRRDNKIPVKT